LVVLPLAITTARRRRRMLLYSQWI